MAAPSRECGDKNGAPCLKLCCNSNKLAIALALHDVRCVAYSVKCTYRSVHMMREKSLVLMKPLYPLHPATGLPLGMGPRLFVIGSTILSRCGCEIPNFRDSILPVNRNGPPHLPAKS